jgi:FkbM family methyltransferase
MLTLAHPAISWRKRVRTVLGREERAELALVRRLVPSDRDVVDLGASVGIVGARAVKRLAPAQRYVGVEMQEWAARLARENVHRAAPHLASTVVCAAICSTRASVGAHDPGDPSAVATTDGDAIPTTTLTRIVREHGIRPGYTLLMDVEGSEADIFANDASALADAGLIIAELHAGRATALNPWATSVRSLLARAQALGFRVVARGQGEVYALTH